jgi:1-phosphofructokinase family hexose kinase
LTPAWQQILSFDSLKLGHVNRAREAHWTASGKVLNVGLALHHLGGPNLTLALVGGLPGKSIEEQLTSLGVNCRLVWSERPTRVCTTLLGPDRVITELVENAATVSPADLEAFHRAYRECVSNAGFVVLSGSLPPGMPRTFYRDLIAQAPGRVVLDASGAELLEALACRPLCVKPNRDELARTMGLELNSDELLKGAMNELNRRGAEWVLVSHGADALWASSNGRFYTFAPARVPVVNPIASGDCLAAGVAWAIRAGSEMPEAIRFGMAAAAENATMLLPARLDLERVRSRTAEITCQSAS